MKSSSLVMGTRGSALALAQSRGVAARIQHDHPRLSVEVRIIRTLGDRQQTEPLPTIGGKGVFTLEIEQAMLRGEIDFCVHSLKDLPPDLPQGLCLAAVPQRLSASDVCIVGNNSRGPIVAAGKLPFLEYGARVGTSSLRRAAQLLYLRPDIVVVDLRGNIDTRLTKLQQGGYDAIILADAGLKRLGIESSGQFVLDEKAFVPAPGQGALAIEARTGDKAVLEILAVLEDDVTRNEVEAERATMRTLGAGCSTPLGVRAVMIGGRLGIWGAVLSPDGQARVWAEHESEVDQPNLVGEKVAEKLLQNGARDLLA